jgi:hypothetical protein
MLDPVPEVERMAKKRPHQHHSEGDLENRAHEPTRRSKSEPNRNTLETDPTSNDADDESPTRKPVDVDTAAVPPAVGAFTTPGAGGSGGVEVPTVLPPSRTLGSLQDYFSTKSVLTVRGHPIEEIDRFIGKSARRLRWLKLRANVDPEHFGASHPPWQVGPSGEFPTLPLLRPAAPGAAGASKVSPPVTRPRRVWFDLGARMFPKGSTSWFRHSYPEATTFDVEMFEVLDLIDTYPRGMVAVGARNPRRDLLLSSAAATSEVSSPSADAMIHDAPTNYFRSFAFHRAAAWTHDGTVSFKGRKMGHVVDPRLTAAPDAAASAAAGVAVDGRSEWEVPAIDFARHLLTTTTAADFVVVKMDIEGGEWALIPHLKRTGALALIDELMLECHPPGAESDQVFERTYPDRAPVRLRRGEQHPDCIRLINEMRLEGVYAHPWF